MAYSMCPVPIEPMDPWSCSLRKRIVSDQPESLLVYLRCHLSNPLGHSLDPKSYESVHQPHCSAACLAMSGVAGYPKMLGLRWFAMLLHQA